MQKITPFLWFDNQAEEAAHFYASIFKNSKVGGGASYDEASAEVSGQEAGTVMTVPFELDGLEFTALNGGPIFKFNPSISFIVNFDPDREEDARGYIDAVWEKLSQGGETLMPLQEYPFSKRFGWVQDKYGVSWQLILTNPEGEERPFIVPSLMFVGEVVGKAEEAMDFYLSVFEDGKMGAMRRHGAGQEPDKEGTVLFADFMLFGGWFAAMDSAHDHKFTFNEAISFMVSCEDQEETDYYWERLSADPEAEQCGWLKDKYGVSWQIVPKVLGELMGDPDPEKSGRVTQAMLQMKKIDIEGLRQAYEGK